MKKIAIIITKVLLFFVLCITLISITAQPIFDTPISSFKGNSAVQRLWWEFLPMLSVLVITVLFTRIVERGKIKTKFWGKVIKDGILGIIVGVLWLGIPTLTLVLTGTIYMESINFVSHVWIWIIASLMNVVMQEYLIRGYLFKLLEEKTNLITAVIVSTVLFVLMHGGAMNAGMIPTLNVTTMSIFISLLLIYTGNLLAPIMVHFLWNTVGGIFLGSVSLAADYPHILNTIFKGSSLVSGGACKMEGSIVVLFINILLILFMVFLLKRKK